MLPAAVRLKLVVAYDGRPFRGWQSQAGGGAVQDFLETALSRLCDGQRVVVQGAGRTDAGVHARGQVAHADLPAGVVATRFGGDIARLVAALNAHLPAAIRVERATQVRDPDWHARFSARGKWYRYRLWNATTLHPLEVGRAWHVPGDFDLDALRAAAARLVGTHDFAAFAAKRGRGSSEPASTVRTLHRVTVRHGSPGSLVTLDFVGDGFLYRQVRLCTGTLVRVAQAKATPGWIEELLAGRAGKTNFAAPAEGLYLMRVQY